MGFYVGNDSQVTYFYESGTYSVASGVSGTWFGLVQNHEPGETVNYIAERFVGTGDRNVGQYINSTKDYEGTITLHPQDWRMLGFAFGSIVDSGSPSPYTHTLREANSDDTYIGTSGTMNPFASFTIEDVQKSNVDGESMVRTYDGCIVDSVNISASEGEPVSCEVAYKGQSVTFGSKTADAHSIRDKDTSRPYIFSDVQIHIPSGTKVDMVKDFNWSLNNNLATRRYLNGSKVAAIHIPENRDYEFSLTLDGTSEWGKTLYDQYYQGGSTFNSILTLCQSAGSEEANIVMSGCNITDMTAPTPAEGVVEYSVTIRPASCIAAVEDYVQYYNLGSLSV